MTAPLGKIQTVLGCIEPQDAGITLVHEHLSMSFETKPSKFKKTFGLENKPVCLENLWWISHNPYACLDNVHLNEEHDAVRKEMEFFKSNGGGTLVENSCTGMMPDYNFYVDCAKTTGVNVVAGTGFYEEISRPWTVSFTQEEMYNIMTRDILTGFEGTDIKAGVIGEVGCSWPLLDSEKRAVQASAEIECELGVPVTLHPARDDRSPFEIVRVYLEAGGHADRLVMSHIERTIFGSENILEFAKFGCYVDFDMFGIETSYYQSNEAIDMPNDAQRIKYIQELCEAGHQDQVTVSHDIHAKNMLMKYGGHGYSHILVHAVPRMLKRGMSEENIAKILKENPQRWLTFKKHIS